MRSLIVVCSLLLLSGCHEPLETRTKHVVHSGEQALLLESGRPAAVIAVEKEDAHALAKAVGSGDQAAIDRMVKDGKALEIKNGTPVKVLSESYNERHIRVLAGPQEGKTGWVPFEWLKPAAI